MKIPALYSLVWGSLRLAPITVAYKEQIVQSLPELVSRLNLPFRLPVESQDVFLTSDACSPNTCYFVHRLLLVFIVLVQ